MKTIPRQARIRVAILFFLTILQLIYFPINRNMAGGITTYLAIDSRIILAPIWAIPYLLSIFWWIAALIWAAIKMEYERFLHFSACLGLTILTSYLIYIIFPTYVERPEIIGGDYLSQLIKFIYGNDQPYNALPSGHTYTTLIITIFWIDWLPKQRILWISIAVIVILSTLFTKQHAVLDLVAAGILTLICYWISAYFFRRKT